MVITTCCSVQKMKGYKWVVLWQCIFCVNRFCTFPCNYKLGVHDKRITALPGSHRICLQFCLLQCNIQLRFHYYWSPVLPLLHWEHWKNLCITAMLILSDMSDYLDVFYILIISNFSFYLLFEVKEIECRKWCSIIVNFLWMQVLVDERLEHK